MRLGCRSEALAREAMVSCAAVVCVRLDGRRTGALRESTVGSGAVCDAQAALLWREEDGSSASSSNENEEGQFDGRTVVALVLGMLLVGGQIFAIMVELC